jgi:hypothetical protein
VSTQKITETSCIINTHLKQPKSRAAVGEIRIRIPQGNKQRQVSASPLSMIRILSDPHLHHPPLSSRVREGSPPKFPFSIKCTWNSQAYGGQPSGTDRSVVGPLTCISYLSSEVIFSIITGKGTIVSTLIMQRSWSWWSCSEGKITPKDLRKCNLTTIGTRGARHQTKRLVWQRLIDLQELFMHLLLYSTSSRALNRQREK